VPVWDPFNLLESVYEFALKALITSVGQCGQITGVQETAITR